MQFLDSVTPLIITFNETANIERTLAPLGWAVLVSAPMIPARPKMASADSAQFARSASHHRARSLVFYSILYRTLLFVAIVVDRTIA